MLQILFPPAWIIVLSSLIGFPAVIISLIFLNKTNPVCYISYLFSAYALTVLCANFPRARRCCQKLIHGNEVSLYSGLAINMSYAVFKCTWR